MHIGLTFDLRDTYRKLGYSEEAVAEFDEAHTIDAIESAIQHGGHTTQRIGTIWQLTEALAAGQRFELVFNISEGLHGLAREAQVPALLDAYQIPYSFSTPDVLVVCHDKSLAKLKLKDAGLATAPWHVVRGIDDLASVTLPFPLFAKPLAEGTGKGVSAQSVIHSLDELRACCIDLLQQFSQPVLVESYLPGREFTVGITGSGEDAQVVGIMEIASKAGAEIGGHTYHNKENWQNMMDYSRPADAVAQAACALSLAAWKVLGCRDGGRIDLRCDAQGVPHFLEANPLPGLNPGHSDLPILADMAGISYQELMERILDSAIIRAAKSCNKAHACAS